jgi:hypothetical protein
MKAQVAVGAKVAERFQEERRGSNKRTIDPFEERHNNPFGIERKEEH